MGLFDKKFCDICGEKIGLLGNRKLADGNMCKDCAKLLSPFCDDRRESTLEQIKAHLQYREENKSALRAFSPMITVDGDYRNIYVDTAKGNFVVSACKPGNWDEENPDVIPISAITSLTLDIDEDKDEIYYKDAEGNNQSYTPRRYEYYYNFTLKFLVNTPYFDDFDVKLNNFRVANMGSPEYNRYNQLAQQAMNALGVGVMPMNNGMNMGMGINPGMNMGGYQAASFGQPMGQPGFNQGYQQPMGQQVFNQGYQQAGYQQMNQGGYNQAYQQQPMGQPGFNQNYQQNGYTQPMGQQNGYTQQMNQQNFNQGNMQNFNQQGFNQNYQQTASLSWVCTSCGLANEGGNFCQACGSPKA